MIILDSNEVISDCLETAFSLREYTEIMKCVNQEAFVATSEFRKLFNGFYRVRQKSAIWYDLYYELMEKQRKDNKSFEELLHLLYDAGGCLDVSFVSKLMATVDPELPIWDQYVIKNLGLKSKWETNRSSNVENRILIATEIYAEIRQWYRDFINSTEGIACLVEFDRALPKYRDLLTNVKKIDYLLWSKR